MNITLIGMTAAGKSTLGKSAAEKLGFEFFDLDHEVEEFVGMEISEMVQKIADDKDNKDLEKGEAWTMDTLNSFFMDTYDRLNGKNNTIIATGGFFGIYNDFKNTENVFFIDISQEVFINRIIEAKKDIDHKDNKNRRIVQLPISKVTEQYQDRHETYFNKATQVFKVDNQNDMKKLSGKVVGIINSLVKKSNQQTSAKQDNSNKIT
jgi:shikimate kinase